MISVLQIALLDEETDDRTPCVLYTEQEIDELMEKMQKKLIDNSENDHPSAKKRTKRGAFQDFDNSWFSKKWDNARMQYKFDGSHSK